MKPIPPILLLALLLAIPAGLICAVQIHHIKPLTQFIIAIAPSIIVILAALYSVRRGVK